MYKSMRPYIDRHYLAEKRKNPRMKFQVYGTVIIGNFFRQYSRVCCIYCEKDRVYYNTFLGTKNISPYITELDIRRNIFIKKIIHLKIKAGETHRITVYQYDSFSTDITGDQPWHCQKLIDLLTKMCVENCGKIKGNI